MDAVIIIACVVAGIVVGFAIARAALAGKGAAAEKAAEAEAESLLEVARAEVEELKKAAEVEGKEAVQKLKSGAEDDLRKRKEELSKREEELAQRKRDLDKKKKESEKKESSFSKRERTLEGREKAAEKAVTRAEKAQEEAVRKLEEASGLSAEEARKRLEKEVVAEARAAVAGEVKKIEDEAEEKAAHRSREIIATAIQRFASDFVGERTVSVVPLPSDDLKGRLIGREGRNIRALEAAAGIDLIIDDTSESITLSCFNPVRREIGRLAVTKLVSDGRIHPTRIEEVVREAERKVEGVCKEAGEQALFDLGLHKMHPELISLLGKLKFRASYAQNLLAHSIEVGFLAGLMASEAGISAKLARRAGLLHDIGKAVDHEFEGTHAEVGAQLARKYGESPKVCQAIGAHHGDVKPATILDHIVDAANQLSAARPGARRELLASYVKRLEELEELCMDHDGVSRVFAMQAGREVRVLVENDKVDDAQAHLLSKQLAQEIEEKATYPGQVRVVVLRETRASDYAR
ncbi:MAG: ribonuclease Y [Deltaproteobacteria bacterium]|nr:ribonuclease Y [Deltaproteobacteria bacterium]